MMHREPVTYVFKQISVKKGNGNNQQLFPGGLMNVESAEKNSRQTPKRDENKMQLTGITLADVFFAKPFPKGDDGLHQYYFIDTITTPPTITKTPAICFVETGS